MLKNHFVHFDLYLCNDCSVDCHLWAVSCFSVEMVSLVYILWIALVVFDNGEKCLNINFFL